MIWRKIKLVACGLIIFALLAGVVFGIVGILGSTLIILIGLFSLAVIILIIGGIIEAIITKNIWKSFFWLLIVIELIMVIVGFSQMHSVGCGIHIDLLHPSGYYNNGPSDGGAQSMCVTSAPSPIGIIAIDLLILTVLFCIIWIIVEHSRERKL